MVRGGGAATAGTAQRRSWAQVPVRHAEASATSTDATVGRDQWLSLLVAVAAPTARAVRVSGGTALVVAVVGAAAWWCSGRWGRTWLVRAAIAVAGGGAVAVVVGPSIGALTTAWLVLAEWSARDRPPLPFLTSARHAVPGIVLLSLVAAFQAWGDHRDLPHLLPTAAAVLLALVVSRTGDRVPRLTARVGTLAAGVVSVAAFAVVGLVTVVLPWPLRRIRGTDPLDARTGGWRTPDAITERPDRMWTPTRRSTPTPRVRLRRAAGTASLVVALLAGIAVWTIGPWRSSVTDSSDVPALAGLDWWPQYAEELDWAVQRPGGAGSSRLFPPLLDVESRYVNVSDGRRVSWQAPATPRARVWIYGGSTTFGFGQRDDHTIASELARIAWSEGIALDVWNRGVSGDLNWEESLRFGWDVAGDETPDLVVFYDGVNDLLASADANGVRRLDGWPIDFGYEDRQDPFRDNELVQWAFGRRPDGAQRRPVERSAVADDTAVAEYAVTQYDRGRQAAAAIADERGVPVVWFWQPDRFTRDARADEPESDPRIERQQRRIHAAARRVLPDDVIDIGDVFDDVDAPVYFDDVHTNELGARVVAEELWSHLRDRLPN